MVVSLVDLPSFVEQEAGVSVTGMGDDKAKCLCPLHGDSLPSFSMTRHEDGWGYKCFGCQSTGTVVEFFKEYYDVDDTRIAMEMICEKLGLDDEMDVVKAALDNFAIVDSDAGKSIGALHMMAAYRCQNLIRQSTTLDVVRWVNKAYREMNTALEVGDYATIEMVSDRACEMLDDIVHK